MKKILFIYNFVIEFTTRPRENLVMGGGYQNIFNFTAKFTTRVVSEFTTRPQENLVVGEGIKIFSFSPQDHKKIWWWWVGIRIFSFLPQDHKIHHKSFQYRTKNNINIYFCIRIHHKTTRKSCGGGGVWNMFIFTTRFTTWFTINHILHHHNSPHCSPYTVFFTIHYMIYHFI